MHHESAIVGTRWHVILLNAVRAYATGTYTMKDAVSVTVFPICAICSRPVRLETAKTDERGRTVHEERYLQELKLSVLRTEPKP
jgi:hypothetical protein